MKKDLLFLSLLALLLLTACGGIPAPAEPDILPEEPPAAFEADFLPELTPLEELSTPAEATEGRVPAENYDLPQIPPLGPIADDSFPILAAELPEADAAFYGLDPETALIRWGDSLAEFDWPWLTSRQILPRLYCFDLDNDWDDELIVVCHPGTGTGVSVDELHVLEKNPDGTLTDYALPWEFFSGTLSEALSVVTVGGRTFSILGTELTDITGLLPEDGDPENIEGFRAGDIVHFSVTPEPQFNDEEIRFRGAAWLIGDEYFMPTVAYAAEVDAIVLYRDGVFTLSQIHLS